MKTCSCSDMLSLDIIHKSGTLGNTTMLEQVQDGVNQNELLEEVTENCIQ